ncbi:MAG: glutathione-dependent disulfide-bond oxidoreductase [Psittacicella sp.]
MKKYIKPQVWDKNNANMGGKFASINRDISGATHEAKLPLGDNPLQLYSLGTPNGKKVTILLEELLLLGIKEAEYDAYYIDILKGDQFSTGFVDINPNSKIPALLDTTNGVKSFESSSILIYLAEKFQQFIPKDLDARTQCFNWLFWSHGSAPIIGGGFGHFFNYAPEEFEYPINRFSMEARRLFDVLDRRLANNKFLAGDEYSIADIAAYPWYGQLALGNLYYGADKFLKTHEYKNVLRWAQDISKREAVIRGLKVNRSEEGSIKERHNSSDIDRVLTK